MTADKKKIKKFFTKSDGIRSVRKIRYRHLDACLAAYFGCKLKDVKNQKPDERMELLETDASTWYQEVHKKNIFAFVDGMEIHYFCRSRTPMSLAVRVFAAMYSCFQPPRHLSKDKRYLKSVRYGRAAKEAYELAAEAISGR